MKFKLPQRSDLITIEQDFCSLEAIGSGYYRYSIRFTVNPVEAQYAKVSKIRVFATKVPNPKFNTPIFNALVLSTQREDASPVDGSEIVSKLLSKEAIERTAVRAAEGAIMLDETIDYTSRFPNTLTNLLSRTDQNDQITIGSERKFVNYTVSDVRKQGLPTNSLEQSLNVATIDASAGFNPKQLSNELVYQNGQDPASLVVKEAAIKFAPRTFGGVYQEPTVVSVGLNPRLLGIMRASTATSQQKQVAANSVVTIPVMEQRTAINMEELLDVPILSVGKEDFYFVLVAENEFGIPLQKTIRSVSHARNVAIAETPVEPPTAMATSVRLGKNVIQLKQKDPNAFGVAIYRKQVQPSQPVYDAEYSLVQKVPLTFSDDFVLVNDDEPSSNEVFYRIVPYGIDEQLGFDFATASTKSNQIPFSTKSLARSKNFAPFSFELVPGGVELLLKDIPDNVVAVTFYRQDAENARSQRILVDKPIPVRLPELVVNDTGLQIGKIYRYQYKMLYRNGSEVFGANELVVDHTPENKNTINTIISQPRAVSSGRQVDVQFSIETNINETQENIVVSALTKQGISQFFSDKIRKDKLTNLIAYNVTRTNDFTGETEDLGTITTNSFSDLRQSGATGASPVKTGFKYTYTIKTFLRAPSTVLEDYEQAVSNVVEDKSYTYKPYFWEHPVTLQDGAIVTKDSLRKNHAETDFTFGNIGKINKVSISLADVLPTISEAVAQKFNKKTIKIQWKMNGPINKVDHYIITLEVLGMKTVVGKRHNISDSNYFDFVDILNDYESGLLVYGITPVYYDYGRGTTIKTNGVVV